MGDLKNPQDTISKASWTLLEGAKDAVAANILTALRTKQLEIGADQVQKLLTIVNASVEEGYHKGFRAFSKTVDHAFNSSSVAAPKAQTKKK